MAALLLLIEQSVEGQGFVHLLIVAWVWLVALLYSAAMPCRTSSDQLSKSCALARTRLWYPNLLGVSFTHESIRWLLCRGLGLAAIPARDDHGLSKLSLT